MAEQGVLQPLLPGEPEPLLEPGEPLGVRDRLAGRPGGEVADAEVDERGDGREGDLADERARPPEVDPVGAMRQRGQRLAAGDRAPRRFGPVDGRTVASEPGQ